MFATSPTTAATPGAATVLCRSRFGSSRLCHRLGHVQGEIGFLQQLGRIDCYRQLHQVLLPRLQGSRLQLVLQSHPPGRIERLADEVRRNRDRAGVAARAVTLARAAFPILPPRRSWEINEVIFQNRVPRFRSYAEGNGILIAVDGLGLKGLLYCRFDKLPTGGNVVVQDKMELILFAAYA